MTARSYDRGGTRRNPRAVGLSLIAVLPPALVLLIAIPSLFDLSSVRFPCSLYPNAVVSMGAGSSDRCPLDYGMRVDALEVEGRFELIHGENDIERVLRNASEGEIGVRVDALGVAQVDIEVRHPDVLESRARAISAFILCSILLSMALLTAVRAETPAATPIAIIYGSVGALTAAGVAGWGLAAVFPLTSLARALLPAAIVDLAMVFPRRRDAVEQVPALRFVPYCMFGILWLVELDAAYRAAPTTMLLTQKFLVAASGVAAGLLLQSCVLAMHESPSRIERRQAAVFLKGWAALLLLSLGIPFLDPPGGAVSAATVAAACSPLPLGYAIARYHLFDLDLTLRRAAARLVYLLALTGTIFVPILLLREVLNLPELIRPLPVLFAVLFSVVVPLDALRGWLGRSIEAAFRPGPLHWERREPGPGAQRASKPSDVHRVAAEACDALREGFGNAESAVFVQHGEGLILAHASGPGACTGSDLADLASRLYPKTPTDLNRLHLNSEGERLYRAGIEASCPIFSEDEVVGWILVSPHRSGMLFSSAQLKFLGSVATQVATMLRAIRLNEALVISEQFAAKGRVHAELAHEIGKPLGTLEVLARKLRDGAIAGEARHQALASVARLSGQLREIVRGVLEHGPEAEAAALVQLDDLIEKALHEIAAVRGAGRVVVHPLPQHPGLPVGSQRLGRVLVNLLDNAIEAVGDTQPVDLHVLWDDGELNVEVRDVGVGIPPESLQRVMDPFVSLREGGSGLGLSISREIIEGLGGSLELESGPGEGTTARVRIRVAEAGA